MTEIPASSNDFGALSNFNPLKYISANLGISRASANPSTNRFPFEKSNVERVVSIHLFINCFACLFFIHFLREVIFIPFLVILKLIISSIGVAEAIVVECVVIITCISFFSACSFKYFNTFICICGCKCASNSSISNIRGEL